MVWARSHGSWSIVRSSVTVVLTAALLTSSLPPHEDLLRLSVGTGGEGGVYFEYGSGLAGVVDAEPDGTEIVAVPTAASVENNRLVAAGAVDAAFTLADVAALAVAGEPPFDEPLPVAAIARLYDNHTHLVVRAESEHTEIGDLAGGTVSLGASGSGTEMMAERLLSLAGLAEITEEERDGGADGVVPVRLPIGESARALEEGRVDAFFWSGGLPTRAVADLAARTPIRLIDLAEHVSPLVEEYGEHFTEMPVPAGTYPGVPAVRTIGVPSLLVVNDRMPDEVAGELTRLLFESRPDLVGVHPVALSLNPRSAIATLPVPLHPGAAAYYRSVKYAYEASGT
ncbi:TAXI family TRAP transporter solute-binding subunit [Nocardiopsis sp. EMB25]|uniref:TAXI family TRAP transporter solute-binding subunit n=1 Tax=Nocardiopsis TaxID=2013 RepID=UPI00034C6861|nr:MULTISPECIES: TAXI family TRAP transporter solute-binding subunit [Nocardiopsis]MCY9785864.1 TAXI family TRAP transporter solute-binding subunit [Nocardiopsis sp. EMB25]